MEKMKYETERKCDGCNEIRQTREHRGLDPYYRDHINFICKKCDISTKTIEKILKWNRKYLPKDRANIFGLSKEEAKKCTISLTIYMPKAND